MGRGGGIGTPGSVLQTMIEEDSLDDDFPHFMGTSMPFVIRTRDAAELGRTAWEMPMSLAAFHWSALWNQLRKRRGTARYALDSW